MKYVPLVIFVCGYGFLKYFRPLEYYLTPYLTSPAKNFTNAELSESIYPVWTYTYLICSVPVFLFADLFKYKALIVCECLCYMITYLLMAFGQTLLDMQIMQVVYGFGTSLEVAYYAFIYANVDENAYKKTTSYVKCSILAGKFLACATSQVMVTVVTADFMLLNYMTIGALSLAFVFALILVNHKARNVIRSPSYVAVNQTSKNLLTPNNKDNEKSLAEFTNNYGEENIVLQIQDIVTRYRDIVVRYFLNLYRRFVGNYSNAYVWKWSLWWALSTAGFSQIGNYVQNLWILQQKSQTDMLNGLAHGSATLLGAIVVFLMQYVKFPMETLGELLLSVFSMLICALLFIMCRTVNLFLSYASFCMCRVFHQMLIVVIMYKLAKKLSKESYGLILGFNTFLALLIQTLLTLSVADKRGFALDIQIQFFVYSCYYGMIAAIFFVIQLFGVCKNRPNTYSDPRPTNDNDNNLEAVEVEL